MTAGIIPVALSVIGVPAWGDFRLSLTDQLILGLMELYRYSFSKTPSVYRSAEALKRSDMTGEYLQCSRNDVGTPHPHTPTPPQ
jgi:hypothetical protein